MATQEHRAIYENTIITGYLTHKSANFYTYENLIENGTIVIEVNNDNEKCLDLYILKGPEFPTASSFTKKSPSSNTLILENAEKTLYSITFIANEDCQYSFQLATSKTSISRIRKGVFADLLLDEGK